MGNGQTLHTVRLRPFLWTFWARFLFSVLRIVANNLTRRIFHRNTLRIYCRFFFRHRPDFQVEKRTFGGLSYTYRCIERLVVAREALRLGPWIGDSDPPTGRREVLHSSVNPIFSTRSILLP